MPTSVTGHGNTFDQQSAAAIIVAAGQSSRMTSGDKVFMPLLGKPLLASTIAPFQDAPEIEAITLVVAENNLARANALVETYGFEKVLTVCAGGARRQDSVWNGMQTVKDYHWLVVHDGARPCVTINEIQRGLRPRYNNYVEPRTRYRPSISSRNFTKSWCRQLERKSCGRHQCHH